MAVLRTLACLGIVGAASFTGLAAPQVPAAASIAAVALADPAKPTETQDVLILRDGTVRNGEIVSETETTVLFKGVVGGIEFTAPYSKSDILEIKRGIAKTVAAAAATPIADNRAAAPRLAPSEPVDAAGRTKWYFLDLKGKFGEDITQTPIRDAMKDANSNGADVIIVRIDNEWNYGDDASDFNAIFRAEQITPIFVDEMKVGWNKQPRLVFWVKRAMAGAAFLPLCAPEIYFTSDGKLGGIGNLDIGLRGVGDGTVQQKMYSARLGHFEGWAAAGGWAPGDHRDNYAAKIVRALAVRAYVLSYRYENGTPVLLERMPEGPDEYLLTDDGEGENQDTIRELARAEGNDNLTLTAKLAYDLKVSRGTADTTEDLLLLLGLDRSGFEIKGRSAQIMENWKRRVADSKRAIRTAMEEYAQFTQAQGATFDERARSRAARINRIDTILRNLNQYGESLTGRWRQENNVPDEATLVTLREQIRLEGMRDRR